MLFSSVVVAEPRTQWRWDDEIIRVPAAIRYEGGGYVNGFASIRTGAGWALRGTGALVAYTVALNVGLDPALGAMSAIGIEVILTASAYVASPCEIEFVQVQPQSTRSIRITTSRSLYRQLQKVLLGVNSELELETGRLLHGRPESLIIELPFETESDPSIWAEYRDQSITKLADIREVRRTVLGACWQLLHGLTR